MRALQIIQDRQFIGGPASRSVTSVNPPSDGSALGKAAAKIARQGRTATEERRFRRQVKAFDPI